MHHRFVDGHQIRHWADGGTTSVDNLVLLCRRHHRLVHEGGLAIVRRDDGKFVFLRPDGQPIGAAAPASAPMPRWDGERMDLDVAVAALRESTAFQSRAGPQPTRLRSQSGTRPRASARRRAD